MSAEDSAENPKQQFGLLAIHAHPDDESSKGGATIARYAAEGHRVRVVTCTGGEMGSVLNPKMDKPEVHNNIVKVRHEEMARAAKILGVEHSWLGYVDSGLPEGDPKPDLPEGCFARHDVDTIAADLVQQIRAFKPHVIITYDEHGGYPHPDHLMVHAASMRAWELAGDPEFAPELGEPWSPLKLYYTHGFVVTRFNTLAEAMAEERDKNQITQEEYEQLEDQLGFWRLAKDVFPRVTTQVPAADWFDTRDDALRAHATQIDPDGPFFSVNVELQRKVWPTEEFELAKTRVETSFPEDDLFAGLSSTETANKLSTSSLPELPIGSVR